jgi:hypothetical protein
MNNASNRLLIYAVRCIMLGDRLHFLQGAEYRGEGNIASGSLEVWY